MILNCASIIVQSKLPVRTVCFASGIKTEQLRKQLDSLHKEAESTRAKANTARLRLMRLSEAADNLRQRAAVSVQTGKENVARELLFQKKKVMQAMEKSKNRIELLDELSVKLNEVISVKETELIGNVALDLEVGKDAAPTPVRFVSPKNEDSMSSTENDNFVPNSEKLGQNEELKVSDRGLAELHSDNELNNNEGSVDGIAWNEVAVCSLNEMSSFEDFLGHIDSQLNKIEVELLTLIRFPHLILESKENVDNSKVQHAAEILQDVRQIRRRIASIRQTEVGVR